MYQLLLFITLATSINAFWSTPSSSCQPVYYPCRCQRLNSCGYSSSGTGYAMPEGRVGGDGIGRDWGGEEVYSPRQRITKPRKFVFIWSDEEEEKEEERVKVVPEGRNRPSGGWSSMVIPPTIKRVRPIVKKPKDEDILDTAALLELNSAEIEKGRIKTTKSSNDEEDLWTDKETPSKGTVTSSKATVSSSKGVEDLWKGGNSKSSNWSNSQPSSTATSSSSSSPDSGIAVGTGSKMNIVGMDSGNGAGVGVLGQAGENYSGWNNGGGYSSSTSRNTGPRAPGSLFGMSSGFGVGTPVGNIGGGWGFGFGK